MGQEWYKSVSELMLSQERTGLAGSGRLLVFRRHSLWSRFCLDWGYEDEQDILKNPEGADT